MNKKSQLQKFVFLIMTLFIGAMFFLAAYQTFTTVSTAEIKEYHKIFQTVVILQDMSIQPFQNRGYSLTHIKLSEDYSHPIDNFRLVQSGIGGYVDSVPISYRIHLNPLLNIQNNTINTTREFYVVQEKNLVTLTEEFGGFSYCNSNRSIQFDNIVIFDNIDLYDFSRLQETPQERVKFITQTSDIESLSSYEFLQNTLFVDIESSKNTGLTVFIPESQKNQICDFQKILRKEGFDISIIVDSAIHKQYPQLTSDSVLLKGSITQLANMVRVLQEVQRTWS